MKHLLIFLIVFGVISCKNSKDQNIQYKLEAIELNNRAVKLSQRLKQDSALILYDKAIELDDSYYLLHSNKVGIYLTMKKYDKALHESELVIKKKPDLAEGWFFAGLLNEHQGNEKRAMTYYKKSIQIYTDRINNPDKQKDNNANIMNRALSNKFVGDKSYIKDFNELRKIEDYTFLVDEFKNKPKDKIMNDLIE